MKHMNMNANDGDKTCNKHESKSFSSICNTNIYMHKYKSYTTLSKEDKYFSPLSKGIMHISQIHHKYFSPFLSIINKGFKVKANQNKFFSPFFCQKQKKSRRDNKSITKRLYAIYIHEEEDVKLASLQCALHEGGM